MNTEIENEILRRYYMITSFSRGNLIKYIDGIWKYEDGTPLNQEERPCARCGKMPTSEGYDACLGYIEGATSACCGHGVGKKMVMYEAKCHDCGMRYGGDDWVDTVLTTEQWVMVFPEHDGILCANCIIKRASKFEPIRAEMKLIFAKDNVGL